MTDTEIAALPQGEFWDMMGDIRTAICSTDQCPKAEKLEDGSWRYSVEFDEESYKWGAITDNLTGERFGGIRKPDEDGMSCTLTGCPVSAWMNDLWDLHWKEDE